MLLPAWPPVTLAPPPGAVLFLCALAGVGKSSLVHLLCHNQVLGNPSWTVGCSVDVRVGDTHGLLVALSLTCEDRALAFYFNYSPPQKELYFGHMFY